MNKKEIDINGYALPPIVCLIGSTRFREQYRAINARLTSECWIVLSCGIFVGDPEWHRAESRMLDELHKRKIDLADRVYCINVGGYIGESTADELYYARATGKPIEFYEQPSDGFLRNFTNSEEMINDACLRLRD